MKTICTILARGGSKGVRNKNIRILNGKPLIAHTILQAQESKLFDLIVVSSDSEEILSIAKNYSVDYLIKRPLELAMDSSPKVPAIQHAVSIAEQYFKNQYDIIVDLDPTSPLRIIKDIENAYHMLIDESADNIITASPARKSPYFNMVYIDSDNVAKLPMALENKIIRRQDAPRLYDMNASIYCWWRKNLFAHDSIWHEKTKLYIMPEERSVDIDTELDFEFVELLMKKNSH